MQFNLIIILVFMHFVSILSDLLNITTSTKNRSLAASCSNVNLDSYSNYFNGIDKIYYRGNVGTCLSVHKECGWTNPQPLVKSDLPIFVLSVGLEGAGHHLWTEVLDLPIHDCVWINGRHYDRDIGDGVAKSSPARLYDAITEQLKLLAQAGKPPCKAIFDAEDSFPTGAIRKKARVFMRPDIINIERLDGVLFHTKYLIILRNLTDTTNSAFRRNFFTDIDLGLRTVENTLTYIEAALRGIPCHKIFIAHYEHLMADPKAFINPLSSFLELSPTLTKAFSVRLSERTGRKVKRKPHKLTQYKECEGLNEDVCYKKVVSILEDFFYPRSYMWPTFAANGFDYFR